MDAGFLNVVKIGQYFMTFTDAMACCEYTLPRDEEASEPKSWIRGNTKIGPVLEVAICCLHGKYGVEIRIMSMNKDKSHSCVRISHGSNKLFTRVILQLIKGRKTTKKRTCWLFIKNRSHGKKELD